MFKKDQNVWCAIFGAGVVEEIAGAGTYPVEVRFNDVLVAYYTSDGKYCVEGNITLFPHPVEVVKSVTNPQSTGAMSMRTSNGLQWTLMVSPTSTLTNRCRVSGNG